VKAKFLKMNMATKGSQCEFYKNSLNDEDLQRKAGTAANIKQYKTKKPLQKK
jgi:hypothetical protein